MLDLENYFGKRVDVVVLNRASLKLIHQVSRFGKIIFTKDPYREMDYMVQKQKEYFDFRYYIDKDRRELRQYFTQSADL